MAIPSSFFARHVQVAERHIAQTISIGGTSYACVAGAAQDGVALELDGYTSPNSITVIVRAELFTAATIPRALQPVVYGGKPYRIGTAQLGEDGAAWMLTLTEPQK